MKNCLFDGMYSSTVWTAGTAGDFDYRNNVITRANYVVNSYFAGNKKLAGTGTGARVEFADIDPSFLEMSGTRVVEEPVALERDSTKRNYLHPIAGSEPARLGAGLFTNPIN